MKASVVDFLQVDGDTSTNDTVIALASGLSGSHRISSLDCDEAMQLQACLDGVSLRQLFLWLIFGARLEILTINSMLCNMHRLLSFTQSLKLHNLYR